MSTARRISVDLVGGDIDQHAGRVLLTERLKEMNGAHDIAPVGAYGIGKAGKDQSLRCEVEHNLRLTVPHHSLNLSQLTNIADVLVNEIVEPDQLEVSRTAVRWEGEARHFGAERPKH